MSGLVLVAAAAAAGTAWITPDAVTVATKTTLEFHYVVGPEGMSAGDSIRIEDPVFHGVRWSQWGTDVLDASLCTAQRDDEDPSDSLLTASTTGSATVSLSRDVAETGGGAAEDATSTIEVVSGELVEGDEIVLVIGDVADNPDCGHEMPERAFHHVGLAWSETVGGVETEGEAPSFDIVDLGVASTVLVVAPSRVQVDERVDLLVSVLDTWGNPVESWDGSVTVSSEYGGSEHTFSVSDAGRWTFGLRLEDEGVHRIEVTTSDGLSGTSNPVAATAEAPVERVWWGDIHVHHGHDYQDGAVVVDENVVYARDVVGLDVSAEALKADPVALRSARVWDQLKDNCTGQTVDGEFVSLLGFEWMGNLVGKDNGHHNFYVDTCDVDLPAHYDEEAYPEGIGGFGSGQGPYEWAAARAEEGIRTVVIPHAPRFTGYNWDDSAVNDDYRRSAEVYSEWGINMEPPDEAASIPDGLNSGNHLGFIAASDNHVGWMGNPYSIKNVASGLAAFVAPSLDRASVFGALADRHTYATTGSRILLDYAVEDGGDVAMGEQYVAGAPVFRWAVSGTGRLATVALVAVEVLQDAEVSTLTSVAPASLDSEGSYAWDWDGTDQAVWLAVEQEDGEKAWSSPIWLTAACGRAETVDPAGRCAGVETGDSDAVVESGTPGTDETGSLRDTGPGRRDCGCATTPGAATLFALLPLWRRRR
jgi:hypothetical protein